MRSILIVLLALGLLLPSADAFAQASDKDDVRQTVLEEREGVKEDWPKREETALRPYKAFANGLVSFCQHTVRALAEGNEKLPGFGSVEIFRGIRRGSVELVSRTYTGMAGTVPRPPEYYSKANQVIDSDPLLSKVADYATPALIGLGVSATTEQAIELSVVTQEVQYRTDARPFAKANGNGDAEMKVGGRVTRAQERYVGKRAKTNRKTDGTGNLLKLARRK
jgi:hypothetical protein